MSLPSFWPLAAASHKICGHGAGPLHLHRLTPPTQRDSGARQISAIQGEQEPDSEGKLEGNGPLDLRRLGAIRSNHVM